jgi:hypothetical protein
MAIQTTVTGLGAWPADPAVKSDRPYSVNGPPTWRRFRISYNSPGLVGVASLTGNVDLNNWPPGSLVHGAFVRCGQAFNGGGTGSCTVSVGTLVSPTVYVAATSVFSGAPLTIAGVANIAPGTFLLVATPISPATLRAQFVTTTQNVSTLTQGWLDLFVLASVAEIAS